MPERAALEIRFPVADGYAFALIGAPCRQMPLCAAPCRNGPARIRTEDQAIMSRLLYR